MRKQKFAALLFGLCLITAGAPAGAARVDVAVASNFLNAAHDIAAEFERRSGHLVRVSGASTGKHYAQIVNGAPYDVFIAADARTPERLVDEKRALAETRFTYALGQLVLWSSSENAMRGDGAAVLRDAEFKTLVLANPRIAPYGSAALEVLDKLSAEPGKRRLIRAENVGQAFQLTASGNAQFGFVAMSQLKVYQGQTARGSVWVVPPELYTNIRQQAVLLTRAYNKPAAKAFLNFLKSDWSRELMRGKYGYDMESEDVNG